jgi:cytochrome c oxidase assembly protein subunit 11
MTEPVDIRTKNRRLLLRLLAVVVGMVGFAFALVPLYNVFCDLTGINGKTGGPVVASNLEEDSSRTVALQFIAQKAREMDVEVEFRPRVLSMELHPGKVYVTDFYIRNRTNRPLVFQAVPSLAPGSSALYFHKIECFCFNQQALKPGEEKWMPLRFYVDTELSEKVQDLALSYTLYDITPKDAPTRISKQD